MVIQGKTRKVASKTNPSRPSPVSRVNNIASLKRYTDKEHALDLLHQMARAVAPIIHEYKFNVGTLCEMYPKNASLLGLNVNHGQKILIRLRQPFNDRVFFPISNLIGVLLHELTHNVHGPHDARFYGLLDELQRKYETGTVRPGVYVCEENKLGKGFLAPWATPQSMRQKRLEVLTKGTFKAEARRVGGKAPVSGKLRQAMLEAAERRRKDSKWCSQGAGDVPEQVDLEVQELPSAGTRGLLTKPQRPLEGCIDQYKEIIDLTREAASDDDEIEIVTVDACDSEHERSVLQPSIVEESTFRVGHDGFEMRSTVRYYVSSSPGRTFIGAELGARRKVVADLNFDHIIESTSCMEMPEAVDAGPSSSPAAEPQDTGLLGWEKKAGGKLERTPGETIEETLTSMLDAAPCEQLHVAETIVSQHNSTAKEGALARVAQAARMKKKDTARLLRKKGPCASGATEAEKHVAESGAGARKKKVLAKRAAENNGPSKGASGHRKKGAKSRARGEVGGDARNTAPPAKTGSADPASTKKRVRKRVRCISFQDLFPH